MVALPDITIQSKIYESSDSLVYRGIQDDGRAIIIKQLKQNYRHYLEKILVIKRSRLKSRDLVTTSSRIEII